MESIKNNGLETQNRYLIFTLGDEKYGLPLLDVKEVIAVPETTDIPNSPAYFTGIMNLRGQVISVMDLRKKLSIKPSENDNENAVIIVEIEGIFIGIVVDSVESVLLLNSDQISVPPDLEIKKAGKYLQGIARKDEELFLIVNVRRLMEIDELQMMANQKSAA